MLQFVTAANKWIYLYELKKILISRYFLVPLKQRSLIVITDEIIAP